MGEDSRLQDAREEEEDRTTSSSFFKNDSVQNDSVILLISPEFRAKEMRNRPMIGFCRLSVLKRSGLFCHPFVTSLSSSRPASAPLGLSFNPPTESNSHPPHEALFQSKIQNPKSKIQNSSPAFCHPFVTRRSS